MRALALGETSPFGLGVRPLTPQQEQSVGKSGKTLGLFS